MKHSIKRIAAMVFLGLALQSTYALCNFNFAHCDYEDCGMGCTVVSISASVFNCYASDPDCCECEQWTVTCNCWFGTGTGKGSIWRAGSGICNGSQCVDDLGHRILGTTISNHGPGNPAE